MVLNVVLNGADEKYRINHYKWLLIFFMLSIIDIKMSCGCDNHGRLAIIRIKNPTLNLVFDASEHYVKLQPFTGSYAQLWILESIDYGRFIIKNRANGKALHIEGGAISEKKIITNDINQSHLLNQQWYVNADGTIECPAPGNLVMDVFYWKFEAGTNIVVFAKHGGENQIFRLDYQ